MVKWCPSTLHCGNAIRVDDDECCEVECSCGLQFCFSCLSETHSPCSCLMWELWTKKCHDESETVNWITVHTKPCRKCHRGCSVETTGGCVADWEGDTPRVSVMGLTTPRSRPVSILVSLGGGTESSVELEGEGGRRGRRRKRACRRFRSWSRLVAAQRAAQNWKGKEEGGEGGGNERIAGWEDDPGCR